MRYGRQRWKLKGKIEVNSRQSWDGEEMVFVPLITDLISIKVGPHTGPLSVRVPSPRRSPLIELWAIGSLGL